MAKIHEVAPSDIEHFVQHREEQATGDARKFSMVLPYRDESGRVPMETSHRNEWIISNTEFARHSPERHDLLIQAMRSRNEVTFLMKTKKWLMDTGTLLIRRDDALVRIQDPVPRRTPGQGRA
jgi:hypothetical protein